MSSSVAVQSIQGLRILYFLEGINFNYTKIYHRVFCYFFLTITLCYSYFNLVQKGIEKFENFQGARSVILIYRYLMLIIFHHFILFQIKSIIKYLDDLVIEAHLTKDQLIRSRLYSFIVFPLITIGIIHKFIFDGTTSKYDRVRQFQTLIGLPEHVVSRIFAWFYFSVDCFYQEWSVICAFTYIVFLNLHHRARMNIIAKFSSQHESYNTNLITTLSQVNKLHIVFESIFSPLPFLSFSQEFLTLTQYTIYYSIHPIKTSTEFLLMAVKYLRILNHSLFVFSIIYFINRFNSQLDSLVHDITTSVNHNPRFDSLTKMLLIDKVLIMSKQKFTAWNMFDLDKGVILSFLSSLITFNVLFVQIDLKAVVDAD